MGSEGGTGKSRRRVVVSWLNRSHNRPVYEGEKTSRICSGKKATGNALSQQSHAQPILKHIAWLGFKEMEWLVEPCRYPIHLSHIKEAQEMRQVA